MPVLDQLEGCLPQRLWPYSKNGRRYQMSGSVGHLVSSLDLTEHAIGLGRARLQFSKITTQTPVHVAVSAFCKTTPAPPPGDFVRLPPAARTRATTPLRVLASVPGTSDGQKRKAASDMLGVRVASFRLSASSGRRATRARISKATSTGPWATDRRTRPWTATPSPTTSGRCG